MFLSLKWISLAKENRSYIHKTQNVTTPKHSNEMFEMHIEKCLKNLTTKIKKFLCRLSYLYYYYGFVPTLQCFVMFLFYVL